MEIESPMIQVVDVLPSAHWPAVAVVIVLACGHRHVRPIGGAPAVGGPFACCFCAASVAASYDFEAAARRVVEGIASPEVDSDDVPGIIEELQLAWHAGRGNTQP